MRYVESFLGIDLFTFEKSNDINDSDNTVQYTNVEWYFDEMSIYNGKTVNIDRYGNFRIIDNDKVLKSNYLSMIKEFKDEINSNN